MSAKSQCDDQVQVFQPPRVHESGIKSQELLSQDWKLFFIARKIAILEGDWKSPLGPSYSLFLPFLTGWNVLGHRPQVGENNGRPVRETQSSKHPGGYGRAGAGVGWRKEARWRV